MPNLFYLVLGWLAVALGAIGVFLPVLPTTPFIILAAFLFGKGSPKARAWLSGHQTFGPLIKDWEEKGAIAPRVKIFSCSMMLLILLVSFWLQVKPWVLAIQAVCIFVAASYVLSRPNS